MGVVEYNCVHCNTSVEIRMSEAYCPHCNKFINGKEIVKTKVKL